MLQVYGGNSLKSVLPSPYQTMVLPGQYQYMVCILLSLCILLQFCRQVFHFCRSRILTTSLIQSVFGKVMNMGVES